MPPQHSIHLTCSTLITLLTSLALTTPSLLPFTLFADLTPSVNLTNQPLLPLNASNIAAFCTSDFAWLDDPFNLTACRLALVKLISPMGLYPRKYEYLSSNAIPLGRFAKIRTPIRYVHRDRTTGSSCSLVLAMLADIPEAVALPGRPSGPYLERVVLEDHNVGEGAEKVYQQCLRNEGEGGGGRYGWTGIGNGAALSGLGVFFWSTGSLIDNLLPGWLEIVSIE